MYNANEIGRAYAAWMAYNHKAKHHRIAHFDPVRWVRVAYALNGGAKAPVSRAKPTRAAGSGWSAKRRAKFEATIKAKRGSK